MPDLRFIRSLYSCGVAANLDVRRTLAFTCKARLNDCPRSGHTSAPCLVQGLVIQRGDFLLLLGHASDLWAKQANFHAGRFTGFGR